MNGPSRWPGAWLASYQWGAWLTRDAVAGAAVAALIVPESLGYAAVAGVPPEVGLAAAPLALIGYALFGGSRIAVVATASAVSAVSASVVGPVADGDAATFIALTSWLAIVTGLIYVAIGVARLGWIANFMSGPVIDGFIIGLAIYIILGQLPELVGLAHSDASWSTRIRDVLNGGPDWEAAALVTGVTALALLFAMERFIPRIPAALVLMVAAMVVVALVGGTDRDVQMVGALPTGLPSLTGPSREPGLSDFLALVPGAFAVALVGFSEGFAAVKNYKTPGARINPNRELVAFGVANLGAGLSSGMSVGGSLSKTATAAEAGGKSQMTNIVAAAAVILAMLFAGPAFKYMPEPVLAAIVIHAVWGLIRVDKLRNLWHVNRIDFAMAMLVLVGTVTLEPIVAVLLGVAVSLVYVIYRVSFPYRAELGVDPAVHRPVDLALDPSAQRVEGILMYRMDAPLLYPNAAAFEAGLRDRIEAAEHAIRGVVIDCEAMFTCDSTGIDALKELIRQLHEEGMVIALARVRIEVMEQLTRGAIFEVLDEHRVYDRVEDAAQALAALPTTDAVVPRE